MRVSARNSLLLMLAMLVVAGISGCSPDDPPTPTQPKIQPPPTGTKAVSITAYPGQIPADGISSTLLIASCTVGGQQAPNNLPVRFSADAGDLSLNGIDPIDDQNPTRTYEVYTAGGQASLYLLSDETPVVATILARFGNEASANVNVKFVRKDQDVGDIVLKIDPESGTAPLTVKAEATVLSKSAQPLSDVRVEFTCNDSNARIDNKKVKTDGDGKASTFIRNIGRDATISASAGALKSKELVEITNEEDKLITLEAIGTNGATLKEPVLINNNASILLRATVKSETTGGQPVPNIQVTFSSTDSGAYFPQNQVITNSNGEAETFVQNILNDSTLTARTANTRDTLAVKINKPPVAVINLISGTAETGRVNVFVLSAANSYDPDLPFGDELTYAWTVTYSPNAGNPAVDVTEDVSTDKRTNTLTVGDSAGDMPLAGDELTIILIVTDTNGLSSTDVMKITF